MTKELQSEAQNITKVFDKQDNPSVGTVTISTYSAGRVTTFPYDEKGEVRLPTLSASLKLPSGVSIISLPLDPIQRYTASNLARELSSTIVIGVIDGEFKPFIYEGRIGDDFSIEMGKGYIVNVLSPIEFTVTGKPSGASAAPPYSMEPWAFVVAGHTDGSLPKDIQLMVTITRTKKSLIIPVSASGEFTGAFVDMDKHGVVTEGDEVALQLIDESGTPLAMPETYRISHEQIAKAYLLTRVSTIPQRSQLLQNYPNPFNPETWIPFQLTEASPVEIGIYDISGHQVRQLHLGYRSAGWYISKEQAAHWDGKNEAGEKIGSGIYFYYLKTGSFSECRKLVVIE